MVLKYQLLKQAFMQSSVGKMANWIIKDSGKEIDEVIIGNIIEDNNLEPPFTRYFNVEIILK